MENPEEKKESPIQNPAQIEAIPSAYNYVVEVDGEKIGTENVIEAVILSKLEKIHQDLKKLMEKK